MATCEEIFSNLMNEYGTEIFRLCCIYVKDEFAAQDIMQETFIKVFLKYDNFRNESLVKTWIVRIAINLCKDYLKKCSKENKMVENLSDNIQMFGKKEINDNVYNVISGEELLNAIHKLKDKYKDAVLMFYYLQLPVKEIAKIQRYTESAVNVRLHRAREDITGKTIAAGAMFL